MEEIADQGKGVCFSSELHPIHLGGCLKEAGGSDILGPCITRSRRSAFPTKLCVTEELLQPLPVDKRVGRGTFPFLKPLGVKSLIVTLCRQKEAMAMLGVFKTWS